jgi:hypothetical protein
MKDNYHLFHVVGYRNVDRMISASKSKPEPSLCAVVSFVGGGILGQDRKWGDILGRIGGF